MIKLRERFTAFSSEPLSLLNEQGEWIGSFTCDLEEARRYAVACAETSMSPGRAIQTTL